MDAGPTTYDIVDAYNHLPMLEEVQIEPTDIPNLLQSISEEMQYSNLSAVVLHRHFALADGEVPIWSFEDGTFRLRKAHKAQESMPVSWQIDSSGALQPYEFVDVDGLSPHTVTLIRDNRPYADELADRLGQSSLNDTFGITILDRIIASEMDLESSGYLMEQQEEPAHAPYIAASDVPDPNGFPSVWDYSSEGWTARVICIPCRTGPK